MPTSVFSSPRAVNGPWKGGCGGLVSPPSGPSVSPVQGRAGCSGEGRLPLLSLLHPSHTGSITPLAPFPHPPGVPGACPIPPSSQPVLSNPLRFSPGQTCKPEVFQEFLLNSFSSHPSQPQLKHSESLALVGMR